MFVVCFSEKQTSRFQSLWSKPLIRPSSAYHLPAPRLVLLLGGWVVFHLKSENSIPYKEGDMPCLQCN